MESRKMVKMNLLPGQEQRCGPGEQTCRHGGKRRVGQTGTAALTYTHYRVQTRQLVGSCGKAPGAQLMRGMAGEGGPPGRGYMYTCR